MALGHSINLSDLTTAVNKSIDRTVAAQHGLTIEKDIIMGRILDAAIGHAEAEKLAGNIVSSLPAATKSQLTAKAIAVGPGHLIVGFILQPAALQQQQ